MSTFSPDELRCFLIGSADMARQDGRDILELGCGGQHLRDHVICVSPIGSNGELRVWLEQKVGRRIEEVGDVTF